jgi:hypothetical protein
LKRVDWVEVEQISDKRSKTTASSRH